MYEKTLAYRYELLPDTIDLSDSSHFQDSSGTVSNGWAVAHKKTTNTGTAIMGPNKKVTLVP